MISCGQFEISKTENLTSGYIESELKKLGIIPLRWAIVNISKENYALSVSFEK